MFIIIEENPNCLAEERIFSPSGPKKTVRQIQVNTKNGDQWCDVMGVESDGSFPTAQAVQIEDSGAGTAWLVFGGSWGIRLRPTGNPQTWSLTDKSQWGEPFKVLDISGEDIKFGERNTTKSDSPPREGRGQGRG